MKKIITLFSLSIGIISFSQVELHRGGQPLGSTITIDSNSVFDHFSLGEFPNSIVYIVNTGATDERVTYQRIRRHHTEGWSDEVCDDVMCFDIGNINIWNRPLNPLLIISANDSSVFTPFTYPNGNNGCSIYTYIIKYGNDEQFADSVQVTYTVDGVDCFLSDNEIETSLEYSVYPNPANSVLNISIFENNTSISLFDLVGKTVTEMELVNGNNTLNIENLNAGVYFYSIKRNGNSIETKKLIIQ